MCLESHNYTSKVLMHSDPDKVPYCFGTLRPKHKSLKRRQSLLVFPIHMFFVTDRENESLGAYLMQTIFLRQLKPLPPILRWLLWKLLHPHSGQDKDRVSECEKVQPNENINIFLTKKLVYRILWIVSISVYIFVSTSACENWLHICFCCGFKHIA